MATDIMATSTTELTLFHSIRLARLVWFARASLKMRTISLRSAQVRELESLKRLKSELEVGGEGCFESLITVAEHEMDQADKNNEDGGINMKNER